MQRVGTLTVDPVSRRSPNLRFTVSVAPTIMNPLAHTIPPLFILQDSQSSAQCLSLDLCLCFHQLLGRVPLMKIRESPICFSKTVQVNSTIAGVLIEVIFVGSWEFWEFPWQQISPYSQHSPPSRYLFYSPLSSCLQPGSCTEFYQPVRSSLLHPLNTHPQYTQESFSTFLS